jgi:hypothetical protein
LLIEEDGISHIRYFDMSAKHQATQSYIGYVYQGMFALIVLLDASDDGAVGVETADDVELESAGQPTLYQLKHSLGVPSELTEKNVGLWKTLGIWLESGSVKPNTRLVFVTCAAIQQGSSLHALCVHNSDRSDLLSDLEKEAKRVIKEVNHAKGASASIPYKTRFRQCELFLNTPLEDRERLINQIVLQTENFNATRVKDEVAKRLDVFVIADIRSAFYDRLIEWWDVQVTKALLGQRPKMIGKNELLAKFHSLANDLSVNYLPNDFGTIHLGADELSGELGGRMERQIRLVNGGQSRVMRAAKARWQARNQRERWMQENLAVAADLIQFDKRLVDEWGSQHGPMCDDTSEKSEEEKCEAGKKILDWSHDNAPKLVEPPKSTWSDPFLTRGSYQQLAEEMKVGWHPEFSNNSDLKEESDS